MENALYQTEIKKHNEPSEPLDNNGLNSHGAEEGSERYKKEGSVTTPRNINLFSHLTSGDKEEERGRERNTLRNGTRQPPINHILGEMDSREKCTHMSFEASDEPHGIPTENANSEMDTEIDTIYDFEEDLKDLYDWNWGCDYRSRFSQSGRDRDENSELPPLISDTDSDSESDEEESDDDYKRRNTSDSLSCTSENKEVENKEKEKKGRRINWEETQSPTPDDMAINQVEEQVMEENFGNLRNAEPKEMIENIVERASALIGHNEFNEQIRNLAEEAIEIGSATWGVEKAREEAGDYEIPPEYIEEDISLIRLKGSLAEAVKHRLKELDKDPNKGRMNLERIGKWVSRGNPDYEKLCALANPEGGVPILVPPEFKPNNTIPKLSKLSEIAAPALKKLLVNSFRRNRLCFVIPTETVADLIPEFHCVPSQWAPKQGKPLGRFCANASMGKGVDELINCLNTGWLRDNARLVWGVIYHPTIEHMVLMVIRTQNNNLGRTIRTWCMDLDGAFSLESFHAGDVKWTGCHVPNGIVAFFIGGTFGWGGMPYAFQVITRAINWELNESSEEHTSDKPSNRIRGETLMYVDDLFGVSVKEDMEEDHRIARRFISGLLGTGSVNEEKLKIEENGEIEVIGYNINRTTESGRVGISKRNVRKAFFAVYAIRDGKQVTCREIQRIASHSSRYKKVCPLMAPFCRALYREIRGIQHPGTIVNMGVRAMQAVWLMRILILLTEIDKRNFTRTFDSFARQERTGEYIVEYDAALTGLAFIVWKVHPDRETAVGCGSADISHWGLRNQGSKMMNTIESLAQTLAIRTMAQQGITDTPITVRGDNKAAMTWATKRSFKGEMAARIAIYHVLQNISSGFDIVGMIHLPHTTQYDWNWRCDYKSRFSHTWEEIFLLDKTDIMGPRFAHGNPEVWETENLADWLETIRPGVDTELWESDAGIIQMRDVLIRSSRQSS